MNRMILLLFAAAFLFVNEAVAQYTVKNDKLYVDYLIIWFRQEVVAPVGNNNVSLTDQIKPQFAPLKAKMDSYGPVVLESVFPGKRWGDTLATNGQGQAVRVPELSQVFKIIFSSPIEDVKAEEVIQSLGKFREVINVVYPSVPVSQLDPVDPQYTPTTQWNLYKIRAGGSIGAWEITTGNKSNNTVAIIDDGVPDSFNEDLFGKASSGGETTPVGSHASRVGGVAGAATNNNKGVASLRCNEPDRLLDAFG